MAQVPTQAFSPPLSSPSPSALSPSGTFPNKRPRLSPNPTSPLGLLGAVPVLASPLFSPPSGQVNSALSVNGVSTMPPPGAGSMGPPSRPVEKATDTAELTDVVAQSGIDIKDEERHLMAYFSKDRGPSVQLPGNAVAFNSITPGISDASALAAGTTFNYLVQYSQGVQGTAPRGGPFSQLSVQHATAEQIAQEQWNAAMRRRDEAKSHHLNDPFLQGGSLKQRMGKKSFEKGAQLPTDGAHDLSDALARGPSQRLATKQVVGPDGSSIVAVTGTVVQKDAPLAEMLALLSLATQERMRGLIEDAAALARERRVGSQGVVPPEWSDLALSNGVEPATTVDANHRNQGTTTAAGGTPGSAGKNRKRSFTAANLPTPISESAQSPVSPIAFPNELTKRMRAMGAKQREGEEARLAKRAKKSGGTPTSADASKPNSAGPGTPGSGSGPITGLLGERAPEAPAKKLTKKEQARLQSARHDEAHQHRSANNTARFMMGSRFGKKYSWMNTGADTSGTSTPTRTTPGGSFSGITNGANAAAAGDGNLTSGGGKRLGEWREDRDRAAGIDMRDWVRVLESDTKEKSSIVRAMAGLR